jgi:hypothetical protein
MKTIYCDLDGVLFDFDTRLKEIFNGDIPANRDIIWETLKNYPNLYSELNTYENAKFFIDILKGWALFYGYKLCILTAIPRRDTIPLAEMHKKEAVYNHFGDINFKIGPYAKDKVKHYKEGDILIDDKAQNILDWQDAGGQAILHIDYTETLQCLLKQIKRDT